MTNLAYAICPDCGYDMPSAEYEEHMNQHVALQNIGREPSGDGSSSLDADPIRRHHDLMMETLDALLPHVDETGAAMIKAALSNTSYDHRERA
jgi:hypothetical protein